MSDPQMEADAALEDNQGSGGKGALLRQLALILLLIVMVAALAYDRKVARPNSEAKSQALETAARKQLESPDKMLTPEKVAEILGRSPSRKEDEEKYLIERYTWQAGVPWRSYFINVLYMKAKGETRYMASFYNDEVIDEMKPGYRGDPVKPSAPPTADDLSAGGIDYGKGSDGAQFGDAPVTPPGMNGPAPTDADGTPPVPPGGSPPPDGQ